MKKIVLVSLISVITACTMQTPVTAVMGKKEVFIGTATRTYPVNSGVLSLSSDKGTLCTGNFNYYNNGKTGHGKFICSDGREGIFKFVRIGKEGHGVGQVTNGDDIEFYFNKQK